jgi:hypothetical protein
VWWMTLPSLLTLAADGPPSETAVDGVEREVKARLDAAEEAGYRVPRGEPAAT